MAILKIENARKRFDLPVQFVDVVKSWFGKRKPGFWVIDGVSLEIEAGEIVGLIGESGCGKSTLGALILRLLPHIDAGHVFFNGDQRSLYDYSDREVKLFRKQAQMIYQSPDMTLNPRMRIKNSIQEALDINGATNGEEGEALFDLMTQYLERVCLRRDDLEKYPSELSGGEKRRVCIARALAVQPNIIVADEPLTGLDISLRNQIIELFVENRYEKGLSYLFISHDISSIGYITDKIAVMYLGKLVEVGPSEVVLDPQQARHPYTHGLLSASQYLGSLQGEADLECIQYLNFDASEEDFFKDDHAKCVFRDRCYLYKNRLNAQQRDACDHQEPELQQIQEGHLAACHYWQKI